MCTRTTIDLSSPHEAVRSSCSGRRTTIRASDQDARRKPLLKVIADHLRVRFTVVDGASRNEGAAKCCGITRRAIARYKWRSKAFSTDSWPNSQWDAMLSRAAPDSKRETIVLRRRRRFFQTIANGMESLESGIGLPARPTRACRRPAFKMPTPTASARPHGRRLPRARRGRRHRGFGRRWDGSARRPGRRQVSGAGSSTQGGDTTFPATTSSRTTGPGRRDLVDAAPRLGARRRRPVVVLDTAVHAESGARRRHASLRKPPRASSSGHGEDPGGGIRPRRMVAKARFVLRPGREVDTSGARGPCAPTAHAPSTRRARGLGEQVQQKGSPSTREHALDFVHNAPMNAEQIRRGEQIVNAGPRHHATNARVLRSAEAQTLAP